MSDETGASARWPRRLLQVGALGVGVAETWVVILSISVSAMMGPWRFPEGTKAAVAASTGRIAYRTLAVAVVAFVVVLCVAPRRAWVAAALVAMIAASAAVAHGVWIGPGVTAGFAATSDAVRYVSLPALVAIVHALAAVWLRTRTSRPA